MSAIVVHLSRLGRLTPDKRPNRKSAGLVLYFSGNATYQALLLKCYVGCGSLRRNRIQPTPCSAHDHRYVDRTSLLIAP